MYATNIIFWIFCMFWYQGLVLSLKLTELRVDKHTATGNSTFLQCTFDLEGEALYAVKWYKDGNEFYRYLPKDTPKIQVFPLPGIHVDVSQSGANKVRLTSLELSSSGKFKCEVSGEAPSFNTVSELADMMTVALPDEGPRIIGGKPRYQIGEIVDLNCTCARSKPAASLHWFINDEQVNSTFLRGPWKRYIGREGLETTTLGLRFKAQPEHFKNGDMKTRCSATVASIYWKSNEASALGEKQYKAPVMESKRTNKNHPDKSTADRVQASSSQIYSHLHHLQLILFVGFSLFVAPFIFLR